jgi:glucosamine-6-phosphate deaminase
VPKYAISMGIGAICKSKKIILVANGSDKAHILEKALFGEVTPWVPASVLKTLSDVEVHADREALSVILEKHPESVIFV